MFESNIGGMLMTNRRKQIDDYIQLNQVVGLSELKALVPDVSEMTIRRDLEALEKDGRIIRVHGGAKSISSINHLVEDVFSKRSAVNTEKKYVIGQKAAGFIKPESSVYIDAGSTTMELAKSIPDVRLLIMTSGLNIAIELLRLKNCVVNIIGGEANRNSISIAGPQAVASISNLNIDIAFIAATAFSTETGFSCGNIHDCDLKRRVLKKSKLRVLLMDSSKINHTMPYTFAAPEDIDVLVSDDDLPEVYREFFKNKNIKVI